MWTFDLLKMRTWFSCVLNFQKFFLANHWRLIEEKRKHCFDRPKVTISKNMEMVQVAFKRISNPILPLNLIAGL